MDQRQRRHQPRRNIGADARTMMGITDGMLRLSVGLEDTDDLIGDLKQAMAT